MNREVVAHSRTRNDGGRPLRFRSAAFALAVLIVLPALGQTPAAQPAATPPAQSPPPAAQPAAAPPGPAQEPAREPAAGVPSAEKDEPQPAVQDVPEEKPPPKKFYQLEPYDVITLDKVNEHKSLKIMPLPFRQVPPQVKRVGKIRVRLLEDRANEYEVAWRNIDKVDFFEELVLQEAAQVVAEAVSLTTAGKLADAQQKYDEAYEFYQFLLRHYPHTQGLPAAVQDYLYLNAGSLFRVGRVEEAFAILEELYNQNREYRFQGGPQTGLAALERVGERLIGSYADAQNYRGARMLLERMQRDFGSNLKVVAEWRDKLIAIAAAKRDEAAAHLAAKRFREAHETGQEMLRIWPTLPGGREVVVEIARQYPLVVVGVSQPALTCDATSLDDPAARRCGQLMDRTLVEFIERSPEGGAYASPWGTVQQSADRSQLIFELRPQGSVAYTGYDLSRELLALANPASPAYRPAWASLTARVQVENVRRVRVHLRHPHVLPQALLQVRLSSSGPLGVRYQMVSQAEGEMRFEPTADRAAEPSPVIVERHYAEPRKAIEDLRKGKLDALDRLLPSDAARLRSDESLTVGAYAFPSLHVLLPNREHPFLANRVFRRALLYGINREVILQAGLLDKNKVEGTRVLSAPLPAGVTANDPAAYAYDEAIQPLPYDPVMSAILLKLADQQLGAAADNRQEPAPELKELVLVHPAGEMPRFIAKQIQTQLGVIGVRCALRELPAGRQRPADGKFDLLYVQLQMREPLVDVGGLFGPGGIAETTDPYLSLTLRRLNEAGNWKDARDLLHELHRLLYEDVTLLPLWQMIDYFVYQRGLTGVPDRPISFYQNVERWRVVPPVPQE
ncbi:MAG: hypothetical protein GX575_19210 [Candidatus Anammoximicrobium sp.]|nr:hypothetical protein [Candidatus Anammoximicrobium sp.]